MNDTQNKPLALIVGAGSGLGTSLVNTFAINGYQVVGLNRTGLDLDVKHDQIDYKQVDLAQHETVIPIINDIVQQYGVPEVVIHNPAQLYIKAFMQTSTDDFQNAWRSMVLSAIHVLQTVLPAMAQRGSGKVIVSGATASIRGGANFSAFASAKFALRGLTQSLAREYQSQGIHIAHVIIDGILDTPRSRELHAMNPEKMMLTTDVANTYLQLVQQPLSTWTHELDLRPCTENF